MSLVEGMLQWVENSKPESNLLKRQVPNVSNQNLEDEKKFLSVKRKERDAYKQTTSIAMHFPKASVILASFNNIKESLQIELCEASSMQDSRKTKNPPEYGHSAFFTLNVTRRSISFIT